MEEFDQSVSTREPMVTCDKNKLKKISVVLITEQSL